MQVYTGPGTPQFVNAKTDLHYCSMGTEWNIMAAIMKNNAYSACEYKTSHCVVGLSLSLSRECYRCRHSVDSGCGIDMTDLRTKQHIVSCDTDCYVSRTMGKYI